MKEAKKIIACLPYFVCGKIVKGFGRGSAELGCPTANFPMEVVRKLPKELEQGVYYGWGNVDNGEVYKVVLSVGWNPFYDNKEKSMETHILHKFNRDLYGSTLKVWILGYLRPELNFDSVEALISAIDIDIENAKNLLDEAECVTYKNHQLFKENNNNVVNGGNDEDAPSKGI